VRYVSKIGLLVSYDVDKKKKPPKCGNQNNKVRTPRLLLDICQSRNTYINYISMYSVIIRLPLLDHFEPRSKQKLIFKRYDLIQLA
jgi:hypothetical protein